MTILPRKSLDILSKALSTKLKRIEITETTLKKPQVEVKCIEVLWAFNDFRFQRWYKFQKYKNKKFRSRLDFTTLNNLLNFDLSSSVSFSLLSCASSSKSTKSPLLIPDLLFSTFSFKHWIRNSLCSSTNLILKNFVIQGVTKNNRIFTILMKVILDEFLAASTKSSLEPLSESISMPKAQVPMTSRDNFLKVVTNSIGFPLLQLDSQYLTRPFAFSCTIRNIPLILPEEKVGVRTALMLFQ